MKKIPHTPAQRALLRLLKQTRLAAGLTQDALAARISEPQSFVSKYESGDRRLDLIELRQVCGAMGVSLPDLVTRFEENIKLCDPTPDLPNRPPSSGPTSA